jgi:hypothetical protein
VRPNTLAEAVARIQTGAAQDVALAEFIDTFDLAPTSEARYMAIAEEPVLTNNKKLDALVGAIAEYLAKQHKLGGVPPWASGAARFLDRPWHTCPFEDKGMREYLTFASPGEFSSRNIFTEERPLRRARSPFGRQIPDENET